MDKKNSSKTKIPLRQKVVLVMLGLCLCTVLLELGLRIGGLIFLSLQEYRNKISLRQKGTYRILCLGESTTGGEWTRPLEKILNQRDIGINFGVIDKGLAGTNASLILLNLKDNLDRYNPDMVITMMGINDETVIAPYEDMHNESDAKFFESFRIYKLVKLLRLHMIAKTKEIIIDALEKGENNPRSHIIQPSSFNKATEVFTETTEMVLENRDTYYRDLGRSYSLQGHYSKAIEMYNKAIEINPENYEAYIQLGKACMHEGYDSITEETLKRAIEINPENNQAYFELAFFYTLQQKYDKANEMFKAVIEITPEYNDRTIAILAVCYRALGRRILAAEYFRKAKNLRLKYYNPITRNNYQKLKNIVTQKGIKLVCMQYPMRSVEPLKRMFENVEDIIFVDNEMVFKNAVEKEGYDEYFEDMFAGDFGHCNRKGGRLLAENIANVIAKELFNK